MTSSKLNRPPKITATALAAATDDSISKYAGLAHPSRPLIGGRRTAPPKHVRISSFSFGSFFAQKQELMALSRCLNLFNFFPPSAAGARPRPRKSGSTSPAREGSEQKTLQYLGRWREKETFSPFFVRAYGKRSVPGASPQQWTRNLSSETLICFPCLIESYRYFQLEKRMRERKRGNPLISFCSLVQRHLS